MATKSFLRRHARHMLGAVALTLFAWSGQAQAQWVVLDPANLVVNTVNTVFGGVNMGVNTVSMANSVINTGMNASKAWNSYQFKQDAQTMRAATDTLSAKSSAYNAANYKATADYTALKTPQKLAAMKSSQVLASKAQKDANDALARGVVIQQDQIQGDAERLDNLRAHVNSSSTKGTNTMLGYLAQFNAQQADQISSMRALMVAQNNATVARQQAVANREAVEAASATQLRQGAYVRSTSTNSAVTGQW